MKRQILEPEFLEMLTMIEQITKNSDGPPWDKNGQQGQKNSTNGPRDEKKLNAMSKKVNAMTKMSTR